MKLSLKKIEENTQKIKGFKEQLNGSEEVIKATKTYQASGGAKEEGPPPAPPPAPA